MDELEHTGGRPRRDHGISGLRAVGLLRQTGAETGSENTIYHLGLSGRVLIKGCNEDTCLLRWVRGTVARVEVGIEFETVSAGRAVLYLDLIGRVEGLMSWMGPRQIDVAIEAPKTKWLRLQQQFSVLAAMAPAERENVRGYRRIALNVPDVSLWLTNGLTLQASVRDISRSGAAVQASVLPEPGSIVTLGSTRGRVVRQFADGFAVQFLRLLPLERFGPSYGL